MSINLQPRGEKLTKLKHIKARVARQLEEQPGLEKIQILLPRFTVPEDEEYCNLLGATGVFLNKTTCCIQIEFDVRELHQALSTIQL